MKQKGAVMHDITSLHYLDEIADERVKTLLKKCMLIQNFILELKDEYQELLVDLGKELNLNDPGIDNMVIIWNYIRHINLPTKTMVLDETEYTFYQLDHYNSTDIDVGKTVKGYVVYYLYQDDELVYVGSSQNLKNRLKSHRRTKEFNHYTYTKCDTRDEMLHLEAIEIQKHRPKYNIKIERSPFQ